MPLGLGFGLMVVAGVLVATVSLLALRGFGAQPATGRRLAGPPGARVGDLFSMEALPERPLRIAGRIRCADPLLAAEGERLVAFHRDIEVRAGGRWRSIERVRETRSFELWDHDGSLVVDPARAAEPLIAIPTVWRGSPDELQEPHASAVARLAERHGTVSEARAVTRSINVTDRLLVLARPIRDERGRLRLEPPPGGYLISSLELPDAMRLLGGRHRRTTAIAIICLALAIALLAIGGIGALLSALLT